MHTLAALALLLASPPALACGQSTHVWIGIEAVDFLPEGHPLRKLLEREDLFASRVTGAMFPDGGYSPLTQDGYGETAHWEPFQTAYLDWIVETYDPPYDGEAAAHVAFLMGLAAHGMADQIYDGVYLQRSLFHDGDERWATGNVDYATDVAMTSRVGAMPIVADVVPYDTLVTVFDRYGQPTERRTMVVGQASLFAAVQYIGNLGQEPDEAAAYDAQFPWATRWLDDPAVVCSPACIQPAVAAYWLTLWERLNGDFDPDAHPVFATWPEDGGWLGVHDATLPEAVVSLGLSRAVDTSTLGPDAVEVVDAAGAAHPVEFGMYYGNGSNVLNVRPLEDWVVGETYTVRLAAGIRSFDGVTLGRPWSMSFHVGEPPVEDASCASGCATGGGRVGVLALLGALGAWRRRRR